MEPVSHSSLDVDNGVLFGEGIVFASFVLEVAVPIPERKCATVVPVEAPRPAGFKVARGGDGVQVVVLVTVLIVKYSKVRV